MILEPLERRELLTQCPVEVYNSDDGHEGDGGGNAPAIVSFDRGGTCGEDTLTITYVAEPVSPHGASSSDYDYYESSTQPVFGTLTIGPNSESEYIVFFTIDDSLPEPTEALRIRITNLYWTGEVGYYAAVASNIVRFYDNDTGPSTIEPVEDDTLSCDCPCTCTDVATSYNLNNGAVYATSNAAGLTYDSSALGAQAIVQADVVLGGGGPDVTIDFFWGESSVEAFLPTSHPTEDVEPNAKQRIGAVARPTGGQTYASGSQAWRIETNLADPEGGVQHVTGRSKIRNNLDSEFGKGWIATGIDRLVVQAGEGVLWLRGDADAFFFFEGSGGTYTRQAGEPDFSSLVKEGDGTLKLRKKDGETLRFTAQGRLETRTDRTGNVTSYAYQDKDGDLLDDEIWKITEPAGRVTEYGYVGGLVKTITDAFGRVITLSHDPGGRLTKITEPDPDGAGLPLTAPETVFGYSNDHLLTSVTDAEEQTATFGYTNGFLSSITHPGGGTEEMTSQLFAALGPGGAGGVLVPSEDVKAIYENELDNKWEYSFNHFGKAVRIKDPYEKETDFEVDGRNLVTTRTDPPAGYGPSPNERPVTSYVYDTRGNLTSWQLPNGALLGWEYDPEFSQPTKQTDARQNVTIFTVDPNNGNTTAIRQVVGQSDLSSTETDDVVTSCTYTPWTAATIDAPAGLVDSVTDPLGRVTDYIYTTIQTDRAKLTSIVLADNTPDEASLTFEYDEFEDLLWSKDELNRQTNYEFDQLHRLTMLTLPDPDGGGPQIRPRYLYEYNKNNYQKKITDPLDHVTEFQYTNRNDLWRVMRPDHDGDLALTITEFGYDAHRRLKTVTGPDPDGVGPRPAAVTTFGYDLLDRQTSVTLLDPDGPSLPGVAPVWQTRYDDLGRVRQTVDPLLNTTDYAHTGFGDELLITLPPPVSGGVRPTVRQVFDAAGNVTDVYELVQGSNLAQTRYEYDALGRLFRTTQPNPVTGGGSGGPVWETEYNKLGQVKELTDPVGRKTTYEYDHRGRVKEMYEPAPIYWMPRPLTTYTYDLASNLKTVTDPLGNLTEHNYDQLDRLTDTTEWPNVYPYTFSLTAYTYDAANNLKTLTDANGNMTTWYYDALDQVHGETNALNLSRNFKHDAAGNLTERLDRMNRKIVYEYDNLQRNTHEKWYEAQGTAPVRTLSFTYDAMGRLKSGSDPAAKYAYEYDALGRLTEEKQDLIGLMTDNDPTPDVKYVSGNFRLDGVRQQLLADVDGAADFKNVYEHDYLRRLKTITQEDQAPTGADRIAPKRADFQYDQSGLFKQIDRYASVGQTAHVASSHYQYDGMGRLSKLVHATSTAAPPTGTSWGTGALAGYQFTYDASSRITAVNSKLDYGSFYGYDGTDQLTEAYHGTQANESYSYDANGNRSNHWIGQNNQLLGDSVYAYEYDAEGNRTSRTENVTGRRTTFEFDHRNRLVSAKDWISGPYPEETGQGTGWAWGSSNVRGHTTVGPTIGQGTGWGWGSSSGSGFGWTSGATITGSVSSATEGGTAQLSLSSNYGGSLSVYYYLWDVSTYRMINNIGLSDFWLDPSNPLVWSGTVVLANAGSAQIPIYTNNDAYLESTESFMVGVHIVGESESYFALEGRILDNDATSNTSVPFSAAATAVLEGGNVTLTFTADPGTHLEWWTEDHSAVEYVDYVGHAGDRWVNPYISTVTSSTYDSRDFELRESFEVHVRVVGDPASEIVIEADILDRDPALYESGLVENAYDYLNQLVKRSFDADGSTGPELPEAAFFSFENGQIVLQFDGTTAASLSHRYLWGPAVDQLLADEKVTSLQTPGSVLWPLADHVGTIRDLAVRDAGSGQTTIENDRVYDAFGNLLSETNSAIDEVFGYTGRLFDEATGLQNNQNDAATAIH